MEKFKKGDVLENKGAYCTYTLEVLETLGDVILTASSDDHQTGLWTAQVLEKAGWTLKTETETEIKELTIDEIADKFGLKPEQVRIKKGD